MLLLKTTRTFQEVLNQTLMPFVILPATTDKPRANDLVVTGRIEGHGMAVIEGRDGNLFVLAVNNAAHVIGFARRVTSESKTAADWFLLFSNDMLFRENSARNREDCTLTGTGFVLPDGGSFEYETIYDSASWFTALAHWQGVDVGGTL
jgi:hypothetical protein